MCGIIGFNFEDKNLLKTGLKEISHRGPDDSGTYSDKNVSLGHNRLSILDLSKSGRQPMSDKNESLWITYNGEIYNFKELRKLLDSKYDFKSNTDTEVLIYLYKEYGSEMVNLLQGMFAFCIYDKNKKIFFIARDRVGIKPLYYYLNNKKLIFCSEIKGILKDDSIQRIVNHDALTSFLIFRANTNEETIFKGIKKLMPGNYMIYDLKNNNHKIVRYWELKSFQNTLSSNHSIKILENLINDSVKLRLVSDVPYGAYLSGGVDSGTIVSFMKNHTNNEIKTFSVGFDDDSHSETKEARFLAEKLKTDHHELYIDNQSIKILPTIINHLDEPMSDPTSIPTYFLSEFAKKHCTVILTGEGADEVFGGYPQYKFMKIHKSIFKNLPQTSRHLLSNTISNVPKSLLDSIFPYASSLGKKGIDRFNDYLISNNFSKQYFSQVSIFNEDEQSQLINKKVRFYRRYNKYFNKQSLINSLQVLEFSEPMVDDLLMKVDKNTMAHAVEGRVPFLDHRIVEFGFSLPEKYRLNNKFVGKYILRESVKSMIPKQTKNRKKHHFFVPIDSWFKNELNDLRSELLSKNFIEKQNLFNYNYIEKINRNFNNSKLFYSRQLWSLIVFQIWYKQFIENEKIII